MSDAVADYLKARRHLARRCAIMKALIAKIGPCTLKTLDDRFAVLVRSIVAQQISGKAASMVGIAKGSGMIHPNLATMLVYILTDAAVSRPLLDKALRQAVESSSPHRAECTLPAAAAISTSSGRQESTSK